ncbi:hypothetical protein [Umezawaea sp. Da 62-37]|uniref:hypothetical protein n=1 Tax=Umezawaea sp. Da 62-37 TaxID=3075927 RepID=UPI0028F722B1|nr:hypothetical protein [Umezawaea sp. Da 62-37]WNV88229.1 hypothetical protein RM788_08025 [Umezawaea sp. Da 62-37]
MSGEQYRTASPAYAAGQLARAVARAGELGDPVARERVLLKVRRWQDVLAGMADGRVVAGSRTPVADTPAWVTLDVAHGGFATGRYRAEVPLTDAEAARLAEMPEDVPGRNVRERLNLWYLGDEGQAELLEAVRAGRYRVDVPEDAALAVVAVLLDRGFVEQAVELVDELAPFLHRLRFVPAFEAVARIAETAVRVATVAEVTASLRAVRTPRQLAAMRETLGVWLPLYDRLVALWCRTVDGDLPHLDGTVHGGWPCEEWPADWAEARSAWLADYAEACQHHELSGDHAHPKSNFARLHGALLACPEDSRALSGRDVGWVRRALANTLTRHGAPGSDRRDTLRATQAAIAAAPTNVEFATTLVERLADHPADGGLPSLDPLATDMPDRLVRKVARALEAPAEELVARGVITSGEALADVLPRLTSRLVAAGFDDPVPAGLHEQAYTAFRQRRSLLLLNLEHQVRFDELPWVAALAACRTPGRDDTAAARTALRQIGLLAITAFPHTPLPNPLIAEMSGMATTAGLGLPLVKELAADIFTGRFTTTWRDAAAVASRITAGTPYADYFDLPPESRWTTRSHTILRWGKETAADFSELCAERAREAGNGGRTVARNGAVLEQAQILTTHNLAALVSGLDLTDRLREHAPELARRTFAWVVRRLSQPTDSHHAALIQVKNAAYAWRQAIFLLGFCEPDARLERVAELSRTIHATAGARRFAPVADGLAHVVGGGRFTPAGTVPDGSGRRFLGWSTGSPASAWWT